MEEEKLTMSLYRIYKHIEDTIKEHGDISQFKEDVLYVINELLAKPIKVSTATEIVVRNEERRINKMQREKDEEYIRKLKCEIDKQDNRIKELEADNYECNNIIRDYIEDWKLKTKIIELMAEHLTTPIHSKKDVIEYFENLAKESGDKNE